MLHTLFSRFTPRHVPRTDAPEGRDSPELLSILIPSPLPRPHPLHTGDIRIQLTYIFDFRSFNAFRKHTAVRKTSPTLDAPHMTNHVLNHVTRESQTLNLQVQHSHSVYIEPFVLADRPNHTRLLWKVKQNSRLQSHVSFASIS